jgi:hypothetical protein
MMSLNTSSLPVLAFRSSLIIVEWSNIIGSFKIDYKISLSLSLHYPV